MVGPPPINNTLVNAPEDLRLAIKQAAHSTVETNAPGFLRLVVQGASAVRTMLPRFLFMQRPTEIMDLLLATVLHIPYIIVRPKLVYFKIVPLYSVISIVRGDISPYDSPGMYVYLQFFTYTHLMLLMADIDATKSAESLC